VKARPASATFCGGARAPSFAGCCLASIEPGPSGVSPQDAPLFEIDVTQCGIASLLNRSISSLPVPRRFQCFVKTWHEALVEPLHVMVAMWQQEVHRFTIAQREAKLSPTEIVSTNV
jgi:hypothetical protein